MLIQYTIQIPGNNNHTASFFEEVSKYDIRRTSLKESPHIDYADISNNNPFPMLYDTKVEYYEDNVLYFSDTVKRASNAFLTLFKKEPPAAFHRIFHNGIFLQIYTTKSCLSLFIHKPLSEKQLISTMLIIRQPLAHAHTTSQAN